MKLSLQLSTLLIAAILMQGCNFKSKEATEADAAAKAKVTADSLDDIAIAERTAKRDKLEKEIADKTERRRLAAIEKAKKSESYKDAKGKTIYIKAQTMPVYAGGDEEMMKYLKANLQYPDNAKDAGEEGTVFVDFVIDKTGKVGDVVATDAVNSDVNPALKDEAVRVVSNMPKWQPAKHKGKNVDAAYSIPIKFQLEQ
ncbi:MAG TPA: energy transducer TonB [Chryseolinea sp.]|nr:energy transducer TonB [Chryseolinea sp.]